MSAFIYWSFYAGIAIAFAPAMVKWIRGKYERQVR